MTQKLSIEEVLKLWEKNERKLAVYIHSPFCEKLCSYCAYQGCLYNKEQYDKYYYEYLPDRIREYTPLMNNNTINSWLFGGGTPSLMTPEVMRHTFSLLPEKFKNEGEKVIEMHPLSTTFEQIDVLKEFNFTTIIFGVQTFDKDTLQKNNRLSVNPLVLKNLIDYVHKKDMMVSVDLIAFLNDEESDIDILKKDVSLVKFCEPDEMSIAVSYKVEEKRQQQVANILKQLMPDNSAYSPTIETAEGKHHPFRYYNTNSYQKMKERNFFSFTLASCEGIYADYERDVSLLGIGEFHNKYKKTFSHINQKYSLIEVNNNWTPEFYLTYQHSFWDRVRDLIDELEKDGGEPPLGSVLQIFNRVTTGRTLPEFDDNLEVKNPLPEWNMNATLRDNTYYERKLNEDYYSKLQSNFEKRT